MNNRKRLSFAFVFLLVLTGAHSQDGYQLISCLEQSPQSYCSIYDFDSVSRVLQLRRDLSGNNAVIRVEMYRSADALAVWLERGNAQAIVSVVHLSDLDSVTTITLPYKAIRGGFWLEDKERGPLLLAMPLRSEDVVGLWSLHSVDGRREYACSYVDIPWESVLSYGMSEFRMWTRVPLAVRVDPEDGGLTVESPREKIPRSVGKLDIEHVSYLKEKKKRILGLFANDNRQSVFLVSTEMAKGLKRDFLVFNKDTTKWWRIPGRGDGTSMQVYDDWFITQEHVQRERHLECPPTGEFGFHRRDGKGDFYWKATPDTEVLAIEGPRLFYRQGCQLMTADIEKNRIVNERVLFKSEDAKTQKILEQVHWLFPMNTPKQP